MALTSRRKGVAFEQEVARILTAASGVKWGRTKPGDSQEFGDVVPRGLVGAPWDGLFVECKAHSSVKPGHLLKPCDALLDWWERAQREAMEVDRIPVLFVRFRGWGVAAIMADDVAFSDVMTFRESAWTTSNGTWFAFDAEALR